MKKNILMSILAVAALTTVAFASVPKPVAKSTTKQSCCACKCCKDCKGPATCCCGGGCCK